MISVSILQCFPHYREYEDEDNNQNVYRILTRSLFLDRDAYVSTKSACEIYRAPGKQLIYPEKQLKYQYMQKLILDVFIRLHVH